MASPSHPNGAADSASGPPDLLLEFSHHDPTVARINNGSFGSCPASVLSAQQEWQLKWLQQPDPFYFNTLKPSILKTRLIIRDLINADHVDEISIVDNATTAAAIVLQHITWSFFSSQFQPGDCAIILHYAYGAIKKSLQAYVARAGGHVIEVKLPFPVDSDNDIISEFKKALELGKLNESETLKQLHHPVVSQEYGNGLAIESSWIGTRDYSAQLVVPEVMEFVNKFDGGIDGIKRRNHEKVVEMAKILAKAWERI